jgi:hypothetical protein
MDFQTSEVDAELGTSQRETMKFCMLTDLERANVFKGDHFSEKRRILSDLRRE